MDSIYTCTKAGSQGNKHMDNTEEREEIIKMWKQIDEKLEGKAESFNLTSLNVKSILHRIIKNPEVIPIVMGLDRSSAVTDTDMKFTRSKKLSSDQGTLNGKKEVNIVARTSRTFLDIDYSNEDDDDDYIPEQDKDVSDNETNYKIDSPQASLKIDANEIEVPINDHIVTPAFHTRSKQQIASSDEIPDFGDDVLLYTAVDDPEYVEFISNLNDPSKYAVDEYEDSEYNFLSDVEIEDTAEEKELLKNRAIEIPLREVENLLQDLIEARLLPSPEHLEQTFQSVKDENNSSSLVVRNEHKLNAKKTEQISQEACPSETMQPLTVLVNATLEDLRNISTSSSSLLHASLENPPRFSLCELEQLIAQLEKHVQLLTQFAVSCYFEKPMITMYNAFQAMINELNNCCLKRPEHSLFNIRNLESCISTCHDAINCESIDDFRSACEKRGKMEFPLPETMFVLSRSRAMLYPELLPQVRMKVFPSFHPYFTREEDGLLALGLYQFGHMQKHGGLRSRYSLIRKHLLPNKMQSQIRLHLKNFRNSKEFIHTLFDKAQKEMVNMVFPLENRSTAVFGPPYSWSYHFQPKWLQKLIEKQQYGLKCESFGIDRIDIASIADEKDSVSKDPLVLNHDYATSFTEYDATNARNDLFHRLTTTEVVSRADIISSEAILVDKNVVNGMSTLSNSDTQKLPLNPSHSRFMSPGYEEPLDLSQKKVISAKQFMSPTYEEPLDLSQKEVISVNEGSLFFASESAELTKTTLIKPVRFAPFKKVYRTKESPVYHSDESTNFSENKVEIVDRSDYNTTSSVTGKEKSETDFAMSTESSWLSFQGLRKEECSDKDVSDLECCWIHSQQTSENQEINLISHNSSYLNEDSYFGVTESSFPICHDDSLVPKNPTGDPDSFDSVRWMSTISEHFSDLIKSNMEDKEIQCDLADVECNSESMKISQIVEKSKITENEQLDVETSVRNARCREFDSVANNEKVRETKQEQNEQTVSDITNEGNETGQDQQQSQQLPSTSDEKLSVGQEGDGSDGEDSGSVKADKKRKRMHSRKQRLRDGLYGILNAEHRALQEKCMAQVIFDDFKQRMFMHQDKVRAIYQLITGNSKPSEMFESMHNILENEHEPLYFLLSFVFPQDLLPKSILENPIRKAYGIALEMIYNIEAFMSFVSSRLSARSIFRNLREIGFHCTCETFESRLSETIGSKSPLWDVISQNIPTRTYEAIHAVADFDYVDLDNWKKMDAPFEIVDLTAAIGPETEKLRSGIFIGYLRSLYTERKGKLYEVNAEWKPTKNTPRASIRRRPTTKKAEKFKCKKLGKEESKIGLKTSGLSVTSQAEMSSQLTRKRTGPRLLRLETSKRRRKCPTKERRTTTVDRTNETKIADNVIGCGGTVRKNLADNLVDNMEKTCCTQVAVPVNSSNQLTSLQNPIEYEKTFRAISNSNREWTVDQDRKILYVYREHELDVGAALSKMQLELPDIPYNDLKQRLEFLLTLLQHIEEADNASVSQCDGL